MSRDVAKSYRLSLRTPRNNKSDKKTRWRPVPFSGCYRRVGLFSFFRSSGRQPCGWNSANGIHRDPPERRAHCQRLIIRHPRRSGYSKTIPEYKCQSAPCCSTWDAGHIKVTVWCEVQTTRDTPVIPA